MPLDGWALGPPATQTKVVEGKGRDGDQVEAKEGIEGARAMGAVVDKWFRRRPNENPRGVGLHCHKVQSKQVNEDDQRALLLGRLAW